MKNKIHVYIFNMILKNVFKISCKPKFSNLIQFFICSLHSTENNNIRTTNELQIDVLKTDIKRLQDETQKITKVIFYFFEIFFLIKKFFRQKMMK
jgi:hypothetical protein